LKKLIIVLCALSVFSSIEAKDPLVLGNDIWPPFIIDGSERGTAEMLVCQALERSGRACEVSVDDWDRVLDGARAGTIDGIAAAWHDANRESYLLYSEPYLTNRIVPVLNNDNPASINSISDLAGLRVAMVTDYSYGEEIMAMIQNIEVIKSINSLDALRLVQNGKADIALLDELVARDELAKPGMESLSSSDTVLAFRDLYFAVSRQHPQAQEIIDDFHRSYELMLTDGSVNEILNVDWLATDFSESGDLNVIMRNGVSLDSLSDPSASGGVFALESSDYQRMNANDLDTSRVKYQVEGKSYSSLHTALDEVFGENSPCKHNDYTSQFDCTDLFKK
jgi:polar amino acid transport system substrate-binding protein